jgi:para-aminobenzoate synthetase component 1
MPAAMLTKNQEIFRVMNEMGRARTPFLFLISFDASVAEIIPPEEAGRNGILYQFGQYGNTIAGSAGPGFPGLQKFPVYFPTYRLAFERVMGHILRGDTYLLNLTFATPVDPGADLQRLFYQASARYKMLYRDEFVFFSPETFVRIKDGLISTYPMKGTIDASVPDAAATILGDSKELAEHNTIVDLLRNDLSMVSENVRVKRFRYVEEISARDKRLLQVSSEICGDLHGDYHGRIGDIFQAMLPAGSVTGAPKNRTVEIIRAVENYERGFYTGVCGIYDGENLDSGVMIRFIEKTSEGYVFKSGGGITFGSEVEKEYQELTDKVYVPVV